MSLRQYYSFIFMPLSPLITLHRPKMADVSNTTVNSDIFVDGVKTTIKAIKESKKRPNTKAIWQYLSKKLASNIDEDYTGEIVKDLVSKKC